MMKRKNSKPLPDIFKIIRDIRLTIRPMDMPTKIKDLGVLKQLKELETLLTIHKEMVPYFRKELCLLRLAVKYYEDTGEEGLKEQLDILRERTIKLTPLKSAVMRKATQIKDEKQKTFFACIDQGIRIAIVDKPIHLTLKMNEARNFKTLLLEMHKLAFSGASSSSIKEPLAQMVNNMVVIMAVDALGALKMKLEVMELQEMLESNAKENSVLEKVEELNEKIESTFYDALDKKDDIEKALNDLYRTMLHLDKDAEYSFAFLKGRSIS